MKAPKKEVPILTMMTVKGLMRCTVPEFKPAEYKGLKQNCSKPKKENKDNK